MADILTAMFLLGVGGKYLNSSQKRTPIKNQINANTANVETETLASSRGLSQNIYAQDDLLKSQLDLERRANPTYPMAVAKQQQERAWGKAKLDAVDDGSHDGAWTQYAAPISVSGETIATVPVKGSIEDESPDNSTFTAYPFDEQPYLTGFNDKSLPASSRRYEQMTNLGVGGYRQKQEQAATVNGPQNPFQVGLIDNVNAYNPEERLASTFNGSNIDAETYNDSGQPYQTYFANAVPRVKAQADINPTVELKYDGMSGGNADPLFSAPALSPQNYEVNHRRNVAGTMVNQIQRGNQIALAQPQGYNVQQNQNSLPTGKLKKSLADIKDRWGSVFINRGQGGITAANIAQLQRNGGASSIPQTSIDSCTRSQDVQWNTERFAQIDNYDKGSGNYVRDNVFMPPTMKDQNLYAHQGHSSNSQMMNAGYLSRTEPTDVTMKQTVLRQDNGLAVQHYTPYEGSYLDTEKSIDLDMTNSASITPVMTRTPGVYAPGDNTRYLPAAPVTTNKEINSSVGGQIVPGGAGTQISAAAVRGWGCSDRKDGLEVMDNRSYVPLGRDAGLNQLNADENSVQDNMRGRKGQSACVPPSLGTDMQSHIPSARDFCQVWTQTGRQTKR